MTRARELLDGAWLLIWPPRCPCCRELVDDEGLCPECEKTYKTIAPPFCQTCGQPLLPGSSPADGVCGACKECAPSFDSARAHGLYDGALGWMIRRFKYNDDRRMSRPLSALAAVAAAENFGDTTVHAVMPVPLHPARLKSRGFNQSTDLARSTARALDAPLLLNALERKKNTREQTGLNREQRIKNVRGAFGVTKASVVNNGSILLVDDTMTTGATAGECARTLKKAGAETVLVLTLARAV